jgi:AcrR family transcriptional regulator
MSENRQPVENADRRVNRTRQVLEQALMELLREKAYNDITVQDITDRANVARPTFYLHFTDKQELLFSSLREIYDDLLNRHRATSHQERVEKILSTDNADASDFQHVADYADFYQVMLSDKGSIAFIYQVLEYLQNVMAEEVVACVNPPDAQLRLPPDFVGAFLAGAQIGVTYWWRKQHPEYSPEEVARMMHQMSNSSVAWAARLDESAQKTGNWSA